jgi:hypothetical protein
MEYGVNAADGVVVLGGKTRVGQYRDAFFRALDQNKSAEALWTSCAVAAHEQKDPQRRKAAWQPWEKHAPARLRDAWRHAILAAIATAAGGRVEL